MKSNVLTILVEKELIEAARNRLIFGFGIVFFVLALGMSIVGVLSTGGQDVEFSRIGVGLLNLTMLLVPLISLVVGSQGFAAEFEDGTMDLLLTQPVKLRYVCLGRILGQWIAIAASLLVGFGSSGMVLMFLSSGNRVMLFLVNIIISLALALVFITLGTVVSVNSKNRIVALFSVLALWFVMIILYDLILVQVLMLTTGSLTMTLLYGLLAVNPADLLRVLAIRLSQMKELFGPTREAMSALPGFKGPMLAALGWLAWSVSAYVILVRTLHKRVYR